MSSPDAMQSTLIAVYAIGLDNGIMTCVPHHSISQSGYTAVFMLSLFTLLPITSASLASPSSQWESDTIYNPSKIASFT